MRIYLMKIPPNFIPIRFETTDTWAVLKTVTQQEEELRRTASIVAIWDQFLIQKVAFEVPCVLACLSLRCFKPRPHWRLSGEYFRRM